MRVGEREVVGRVLEERVVEELNLVKMDVGLAPGEPEGRGGGDEVDVVAACGELNAELRGDDPGAAVGGIAGDADAERAGGCWGSHKTFS